MGFRIYIYTDSYTTFEKNTLTGKHVTMEPHAAGATTQDQQLNMSTGLWKFPGPMTAQDMTQQSAALKFSFLYDEYHIKRRTNSSGKLAIVIAHFHAIHEKYFN